MNENTDVTSHGFWRRRALGAAPLVCLAMGLELVCSRGASDDGDPGNSPVRRVNEQTARRATGVSGRGKSCPTFAGASAMSSTA